jgi:hypothetical protein
MSPVLTNRDGTGQCLLMPPVGDGDKEIFRA